MSNNQAGKGDKPRNCHSKNFRENHSNVDWKSNQPNNKQEVKKGNKTRITFK